jgi:protein dithiol oxidoreductase (disulfide-forming)
MPQLRRPKLSKRRLHRRRAASRKMIPVRLAVMPDSSGWRRCPPISNCPQTVVEVFWLGCPHCAALEPYIQSWLKNKPAYVEFLRVPVMWGPVHRAHAHLFYTIAALNRQDLVQKAFDAIQNQHEPLFAPSEAETLKAQQAWAKENGIPADDFAKAYNSFTVNSNLQRAEQLTQRYHVEGVPLIVINGKFTTDVAKAKGQSNLIALIDDLAAAEHKH